MKHIIGDNAWRNRKEVEEALKNIRKMIEESLPDSKISINKFGETMDYYIMRRWTLGALEVYFRKYISHLELVTIVDPLIIARSFIRDCQVWEENFKKGENTNG